MMAETIHDLVCEECGKDFQRSSRQLASSKCKNIKKFFCSRSCSVRFQNKKVGHGDHRSFIERWLETRIREQWPHIDVIYNDKEAVGSELDIFVPSWKVAIELHGKQHYEPIFGQEVLDRTKKNDEEKRVACVNAGIQLIEIDMSKMNSAKRDPEFIKICNLVFGIFTERAKK